MLGIENLIPAISILASTGIVVASWIVTAGKRRDHHLFEMRVDRRLAMCGEVIEIWKSFEAPFPFKSDPGLTEKLRTTRISVQLYGYQNEVDQYEAFVRAVEANDTRLAEKAVRKAANMARLTVRTELGYAPGA